MEKRCSNCKKFISYKDLYRDSKEIGRKGICLDNKNQRKIYDDMPELCVLLKQHIVCFLEVECDNYCDRFEPFN